MKTLLLSARIVRRLVFPAAGLAWLIGWCLGDRQPPWLWLYYIPAPFIAAWGLLDWLFRMHRAGWLRSGITIAITLLALSKTFLIDSRWNRSANPPPDALRVAHWNVAHVPFGYIAALRDMADNKPDLAVFVEARYSDDLPKFVKQELGLSHVFQDQGMAVLSRYPFEPQGTISLPNGRAWWARVDTPKGPLHLVTLDVLSHPALKREPVLAALVRWIINRPNPAPLLLVGDFNTTRDARVFGPLRQHLRHAYEIAGRGWPYSWPLPFPVYAIDHAWVSPDITVLSYQLRSSALSDHRRQEFTISYADQAENKLK